MLFLTVLAFSSIYANYVFDNAMDSRQPTPPYRITLPLQQQELEVKWNYFGKIRRFTFKYENCCIYEELKKALHSYEPGFEGILTWKDSENDTVLLNSSNELNLALRYKSEDFLRLNTIADRPSNSQAANKSSNNDNPHKVVSVENLASNKETEIEADANHPSEEGRSKLLKQLVKKQGMWPIIIIGNYKRELEITSAAKNQKAEEETVETTTVIMVQPVVTTTPTAAIALSGK
uniref:PB1 domain-containing protein n=1 Tax=Setaria digitata TaxID=48799 RepID=A0A915PMT2_9BILA